MKFLAVVTPPDIYHGFYTHTTFWEEKFTPVNMTSCVRRNVVVLKYKELESGEIVMVESDQKKQIIQPL